MRPVRDYHVINTMKVHSRMEVQSGILEWKCIPEWNCGVEVHSRVEYLCGTKCPLQASVRRHNYTETEKANRRPIE